ncbi:MAG: homocysteine biosynthesis protein [Cyanobium sp.]
MSQPAPRPSDLPQREAGELSARQREGRLRVRLAADWRALVAEAGLAEAYARTDVVVAADAGFTDQGSLHLHLGPTDPPIRLREPSLGGIAAQAAGGGADLVLPIGGGLAEGNRRGGAQVLAELLAGLSVDFSSGGERTRLQPRRELHTRLDLERIGGGRLLLHRAIVENGVVAVSSAEGLLPSPYGTLLGPFANALYTAGGAGSIGLTMPSLAQLGPGSPVLVAGAIGWVLGSGSGHQSSPRRLAGGQARTPGAVAAVSVDLHDLQARWLRPCFFEGHGSALLVPIAAPISLLDGATALQAATDDELLEAPLLDVSIPRRLKPGFGSVSYARLHRGTIELDGRHIRAAPAHSPRLAEAIGRELVQRLEAGSFPLRPPLLPLGSRPSLIPLDP